MEAYSVDVSSVLNRKRDVAYRWKDISIGRPGSLQHPPARLGFTLCAKGNFVYLFGGSDHEPKNDLWCLDVEKGDWSCVQPHIPIDQCECRGVPAGRHGHSAGIALSGLYQGKMVVFGGKGERETLMDIWTYDFDTKEWRQIPVPADEAKAPPTAYQSMVFWGHEGREDLLLFGGEGEKGTTIDTWVLQFPEIDVEADIAAAEEAFQKAQEGGDAEATTAAEAALKKAKGEEDPLEPEKPEEEMDDEEKVAWIKQQEAAQRKKDLHIYKTFGHWTKVVPKAMDGGPPPMSQHYAVIYHCPTRQPHRGNDGQVMLVFGGYNDNHFVSDVWELDMPFQKVPTWRRHRSGGTIPAVCNTFAGTSVDHYRGRCEYAPGPDPPIQWEPGRNILAMFGKMGPSEGAKIAMSNYDLHKKEWTKIRLVGGPSHGFVGQIILTENQKFVAVGGNDDIGFPLMIHLREEVQQLQRNSRYPGFFGKSQAGGMFKLSVPTELEQRERTKGRHRMLTCEQPSSRDAKLLAKAKKKVEDDRLLRKAEFRRTMNPSTRPEVVDSCPPLSVNRLESMPQYFSLTGTFNP